MLFKDLQGTEIIVVVEIEGFQEDMEFSGSRAKHMMNRET